MVATRQTKKYKAFIPEGSRIINYAVKATGRPCDICGHEPEKRDAKQGYEHVSEEMKLMRVKLKPGQDANDVHVGRSDFTVTGNLIEMNVCADTANCRERAKKLKKPGTDEPLYDDFILARFR